MLEALERIEEYTEGFSQEEFVRDQKTIDAVIRNLEILGEACGQIPEEIRSRYPLVPWKRIVGLRNVVLHRYFGVDLETVWFIIKNQIPPLKADLRTIRDDTGQPGKAEP
ncbi:DUF86 domain-containing protein [Methanoculleus sp. FWC-SCC1]|uniref:DUF86 domain-containing protein n=1 Tax=Methanoculleus frigidifontis TaxID=2584085 RepID=A0ABT8MCN5_9EURY|nr:DUF86 domain-containing protein [Methanoculleus sp. FWC-SCC1]MDN7025697.1 DUF86 domain-containing protein [Methanoculleus sp. FWC-SCC1]